jgi:hypothetical protein
MVGVLITSMSVFLGNVSSFYGVTPEPEFQETYDIIVNQSSVVANDVSIESGDIAQGSSEITDQTSVLGIGKASLNVIRLPFKLITGVPTMIDAVSERIGIPSWFIGAATSMILITIVFLVVGAVFRREV